jgi:phosphatidylserine/phosphatidylglycerophosphate/cardiolipin synthase-like enzyme
MDWIKVIKNEEFLAHARALLEQTKKSVDICTYKFELSERPDASGLNNLVAILYAIARKGLPVRVLLNTTGRRSGLTRINENAARILKKNGLEVRTLPDGRCQHAKILLIDGCLGLIGSHNWSPRSMTENFEVAVEINHAGHLQGIQEHFDRIWESSKRM